MTRSSHLTVALSSHSILKNVRRYGMRVIEIDGSHWRTTDDIFDTLLPALGAPNWHGRNFNALVDSIAVGQINEVEPPYVIKIGGAARMTQEVLDYLRELRGFIDEVIADGVVRGRDRRQVHIVFEGDF